MATNSVGNGETVSLLRRVEGLSFRAVDGEGIIYNPETRRLHVLNKTGLFVWGLCESAHDVREIAKSLSARFGIDEETALQDAVSYLDELKNQGLVTEDV